MTARADSNDENALRGTLGTARNATLLLRLLSEGPAHQQLTELAGRSGMSLPTVHRLLRSLVVAGLAEQDKKSLRYGLGPEVVRLAHCYLTRLPVLRALAPYLVELRNSMNATVQVAIFVRGSVTYIDRVDGEDSAGVFRDSHAIHEPFETAAGRVLIAHGSDAAWEDAVSDLSPVEAKELTHSRKEWVKAKYVVHELGFKDAVEIAVPVTDGRGQVLAALSAIGSRRTMGEDSTRDRIVAHLTRVTHAVSRTVADV